MALALPAAASARAGHGLRLDLPAPGHITIEKFTLKVSGARGLPKRLHILPQRLKGLPASVRVLYAQRTIRRKRSLTYSLVLLAVNVATPAARSAGEPKPSESHLFTRPNGTGSDLGYMGELALFFGSPVAASIYAEEEEADRIAAANAFQWRSADQLGQATAATALKGVVDPNGDGKVDRGVDTGHYDDGHSFGWAIKSKADEKKTFAQLANELLTQYIVQLEDSFKYDIDGDGKIESPTSGGNGQQIDTQVGAPVLTGGP